MPQARASPVVSGSYLPPGGRKSHGRRPNSTVSWSAALQISVFWPNGVRVGISWWWIVWSCTGRAEIDDALEVVPALRRGIGHEEQRHRDPVLLEEAQDCGIPDQAVVDA